MQAKVIRDYLRLSVALLCSILYLPHISIYLCRGEVRTAIDQDVKNTGTDYISVSPFLSFLYCLHNNRYFRNLFYFRIGPIASLLIGWYRPGDRYFQISYTTKIGPGVKVAHPYATILNAESIGKNFTCIQCTTLGAKDSERPIIGDNVYLGANVTIIGHVRIGNNVTIGAGAVVVKDIPDNAIAVGNPAKVIKYKENVL